MRVRGEENSITLGLERAGRFQLKKEEYFMDKELHKLKNKIA